jgi:hypothetical protein
VFSCSRPLLSLGLDDCGDEALLFPSLLQLADGADTLATAAISCCKYWFNFKNMTLKVIKIIWYVHKFTSRKVMRQFSEEIMLQKIYG